MDWPRALFIPILNVETASAVTDAHRFHADRLDSAAHARATKRFKTHLDNAARRIFSRHQSLGRIKLTALLGDIGIQLQKIESDELKCVKI